ncbi:MAG: DinB family protein [Phycisphaerales bacterium JB043]
MSTTTAQNALAGSIRANLMMSRMYVEALAKDMDPKLASCKPEGADCNHPTWNLGHLSIYFDDVLRMIGRDDLVSPREGYEALFAVDVACEHDPDGTKYPPYSEVCEYYLERLDTMLNALQTASEETLSAPNERFIQDSHPTIGDLVNFMMSAHTFLHHGQTSTWRRAMGLGPCF